MSGKGMEASSSSALQPSAYRPLAVGSVRPTGWLAEQLAVQAAGLTGQLEELWPDVGPRSAWKGGDGEAWERGPYYLDGLVPLAHLTGDPGLQSKAERWIDGIVASAREDGFFGPATNDDWWSRMVALKALIQHHEATGDERIPPLIERYLRHQAEALPGRPLVSWGRVRGAENLLALYWHMERAGDELRPLADTLLAQVVDWGAWLEEMPAREVTRWWDHMTHVVNVAMGLKEPATRYLMDGDSRHRRQLDAGLANLDRWHGQVHGFFSGDEWLAGTDARRGTELCAVVEAMFSFEVLLRIWGGVDYGDRLENLAYNLLPAALDARMTAHQYHQQANQVLATVANRDWTQAGDDCTIFGLEPNFGCCTANYHQGWPKFVAALWMATTDEPGLVAVAHGPSRVETDVLGSRVRIEAETSYPFSEEIRYRIDPARPTEFVLAMRVPGWCQEPKLRVNGTPEQVDIDQGPEPGYLRVRRRWSSGDVVELSLPMAVRMQERPSGGVGVSLGPLRLVASPGEIWTRLPGSPGLGDFEVRPRRGWNMGLAVRPETIAAVAKVERLDVGSPPWGMTTGAPPLGIEGVPVRVWLPGRRVRGWRLVEDDVPPPPPLEQGVYEPDVYGPLVPYGSTRVRIAEFPNAEPSRLGQLTLDHAPE